MVQEILEKIEKDLGLILKHSAIIYADGTVLQSTFPKEVNTRGIGDNLAESIKHLNDIIKLLNYEETPFSNELIFRTPNYYILAIRTSAVIVVLILDLAQDKSEIRKTWEIHNIYRTISEYLDEIRKLADWDKTEFEIEDIKEETEKVEKEIDKILENGKKLREKATEIRKEKKKIREEKKEIREIQKMIPEEELIRLEKEKEKLKKKDEKLKKKEKKILEETEKLREKRKEMQQKKDELQEKEKEITIKKEETKEI